MNQPVNPPNKGQGAGVVAREVVKDGRSAPLKAQYRDLGEEEYFTVSYFEWNPAKKSSTSKKFHFALLPAIETQLQYGPSGSLKGGAAVPEVKPGLITNTAMKYANIIVPGGGPVIQTIGIKGTTHQLVGAFIGSEGAFNVKPSLNPIYPVAGDSNPPYSNGSNAFLAANTFDAKVAQSGRCVVIDIQSDVKYRYEGVILNFKFYAVKAERVYYILDLLATRYPGIMVK